MRYSKTFFTFVFAYTSRTISLTFEVLSPGLPISLTPILYISAYKLL